MGSINRLHATSVSFASREVFRFRHGKGSEPLTEIDRQVVFLNLLIWGTSPKDNMSWVACQNPRHLVLSRDDQKGSHSTQDKTAIAGLKRRLEKASTASHKVDAAIKRYGTTIAGRRGTVNTPVTVYKGADGGLSYKTKLQYMPTSNDLLLSGGWAEVIPHTRTKVTLDRHHLLRPKRKSLSTIG